jgi:hypothetical protein
MFFKFRRMRAMDPLQVAMTGVRMGERYLQIFCADATLTSGLATKSGLSGVAALAAPDERQASRARGIASTAGALIDVQIAAAASPLPWPRESFDMVVIDNTAGNFTQLTDADRVALTQSAREMLRQGGRLELIERVKAAAPASEEALRAAGFRPVRTLAEKGGFRFVEALKG